MIYYRVKYDILLLEVLLLWLGGIGFSEWERLISLIARNRRPIIRGAFLSAKDEHERGVEFCTQDGYQPPRGGGTDA